MSERKKKKKKGKGRNSWIGLVALYSLVADLSSLFFSI